MINRSTIDSKQVVAEPACQHCGQTCDDIVWLEDKPFCCHGCKTVFEILSANDLCEYYSLDEHAGISIRNAHQESFTYLDEKSIRKKVVEFDSPSFSKVTFFIPAIHCISCIWLLENLQRINNTILRSEVNFARKNVTVEFNPQQTELSAIAALLSSIGYVPQINLDQQKTKKVVDKSLLFKLSVAGFCFGNVMLFSFPEYLGIDQADHALMRTFSWLNLVLSIPVFFYSGFDYLRSAAKSFKQKQINIDVPIAAGLIALFFRSCYDIISATGPGYLDSFTGLVFFLLIGRWFQSKTYESLAFDRDFTSYFPLAVNKLILDEWKPVVIYELQAGDQIRIRNMEIIPADSVLLYESAYIDYSFVTGESKPVLVKQTETIYAGGRLIGSPVRLVVEKKTSQSQLTSLWNHEAFKKISESKYQKVIDSAARKFTWIVMGIAVVTAVYWQITHPSEMWLVLTSVLMVACPCALALAAPFTYGSMLRVFGKHQLYLKNADVIERMAAVDAVVFDKTGTITHGKLPEVSWIGEIEDDELAAVRLLTGSSAHPLSVLIHHHLKQQTLKSIENFKEIPGKGIEAHVDGKLYKIGSTAFVGFLEKIDLQSSRVFVSIDGEIKGYFSIRITLRKNLKGMLQRLGSKCKALLSGDNNADQENMKEVFASSVQLLFNQSPHDKLDFIRQLQNSGQKVLMMGDGLNDSGAFKQSDVGLAVTDNSGVFTPACDGILYGEKMNDLDKFLSLAKSSSTILKAAFAISFAYNAVALSFAVTGNLTPLVAAILMPVSSISVVGFSTLAVNYVAQQKLKS
ncbi:MAG TPA: heavy metal translocating P-type ATPase metal-binding domain-containing protein [Cyclobacteriaceae bacterium]